METSSAKRDVENVYIAGDNLSEEKLLSSENENGDYNQALEQIQKHLRKQRRRYFVLVKNVIVYALALWGIINLINQAILKGFLHEDQPYEHIHEHPHEVTTLETQPETQPQTTIRPSCACGNSTIEAIALGCVYDSLSPAWLQPHCHDHSLVTEFDRLGDGPDGTWTYYADRNHTQELSMDQLKLMADDPEARFHVSWEWHVVHCYMYWIKMFREKSGGATVEARFNNEGHIRHCAKVFQKPVWGTSSGVVTNADLHDS
ncbi:hypothetical protein B7494_g3899 [Chlorociboria aeruginascens]|nr:hypothetical protein B7494_g3899 [Chlorociboria aeruginascens]